MLIAEELDVPWGSIKIEQAATDAQRFGKQRIYGSEAIASDWLPLRQAGATARAMLVSAAAAAWEVDVSTCHTSAGAVHHAGSGRTLPYSALVAAAARQEVPRTVLLKDVKQFNIIGRTTHGIDGNDIVTGRACYGIDKVVPGMVFAAVLRPPVFGARLSSYNAGKALQHTGVLQVITLPLVLQQEFSYAPAPAILVPGGIAVIATSTWSAFSAVKLIEAAWDHPDKVENSAGIEAALTGALDRAQLLEETVRVPASMAAGPASTATATFERQYWSPFLAHAQMEPMNCIADVRGDSAAFWAPCGEPQRIVDQVGVQLLGLKREKVQVNTTLIGGSFGRRSQIDYAAEAALISRQIGKPVKLTYTREDDLQRGYYKPASAHRMRAQLDANGLPTTWEHTMAVTPRVSNPAVADHSQDKMLSGWDIFGGANGDLWYPVGAQWTRYAAVASAVPRGSWRGVAYMHNAFVIECFIDELANAAKQEPLAYRQAVLRRPCNGAAQAGACDTGRFAQTVKQLQEMLGGLPPTRRRRVGVACMPFEGGGKFSYVAVGIELGAPKKGVASIAHVYAVVDCGTVVNPGAARAQLEGGILFGLSAALYGEISIKDGHAEQSNFSDYPVLRLAEAPPLSIHLVASVDHPGPLGEVITPLILPALANALATQGRRQRRTPLQLVAAR